MNPGDVRILDTLSGHDSARARAALAERGACFLLLQECSPDQKPIEMAFAKLKAHLRVAEARIYETLWYRIAGIYDLFQPEACWNVIRQAGYVHE